MQGWDKEVSFLGRNPPSGHLPSICQHVSSMSTLPPNSSVSYDAPSSLGLTPPLLDGDPEAQREEVVQDPCVCFSFPRRGRGGTEAPWGSWGTAVSLPVARQCPLLWLQQPLSPSHLCWTLSSPACRCFLSSRQVSGTCSSLVRPEPPGLILSDFSHSLSLHPYFVSSRVGPPSYPSWHLKTWPSAQEILASVRKVECLERNG